MTDLETQEAIAWANKVIKAKGTSYTPASRNAAAFILASCALQDAAPVEPLCPFTDRPAWECAAACTCAHFKPTGIIKHTNPPAAPVEPVAWMYGRADTDPYLTTDRNDAAARHARSNGWPEVPLYAHPPAAPTDALVEKQ